MYIIKNLQIIGAVLLMPFILCAQDFEKVAPKQPKQKEHEITVPESPTKPKVEMVQEGEVLVEALKGLTFVDSQDKVAEEAIKTEGLQMGGIHLSDKAPLSEKLRSYLGEPVTFEQLHDIANDVILYYRGQGHPVVDVIVPEQDITHGVVQYIVVEGTIGKVKAEGNEWFCDELLTEQVRVQRGGVVVSQRLLKDLEWLNNNPFREVDMAFTPGANVGETDLVLQVNDRFPVRFYAGYEDSGNDLTGDERWLAGFNWGNAFFQDHELSYQFTTSSDFEALTAHSGVYMIPLPWRHRLNIFGSYTESEADTAGGALTLKGTSWQIGTRYVIPLPNFEFEEIDAKYQHEFEVGFDFKQSDNNLEFGGTQVFNTLTDINQWAVGYTAGMEDPFGATTLTIRGFYSPGGWTDNSEDAKYNTARQFAEAEYVYGRFGLERITRLPWDFTFNNRFTFQLADGNLLGSEQLGFGGYNTVRGYDEREVNGDEGYIINLELRTPPVSIAELFGETDVKDQLQFLAFWDYGQAELNRVTAGTNDNIELSSVGVGVRYEINPYVSIRADYGFQLIDAGNTRHASRLHLGVVVSF